MKSDAPPVSAVPVTKKRSRARRPVPPLDPAVAALPYEQARIHALTGAPLDILWILERMMSDDGYPILSELSAASFAASARSCYRDYQQLPWYFSALYGLARAERSCLWAESQLHQLRADAKATPAALAGAEQAFALARAAFEQAEAAWLVAEARFTALG